MTTDLRWTGLLADEQVQLGTKAGTSRDYSAPVVSARDPAPGRVGRLLSPKPLPSG